VPTTADALWLGFLAAVLAVAVLVGALAVAMIIAQRRMAALHRAYAHALLTAQEEERGRVAREVHDDAVQRLAVLRHELRLFEALDADLSAAQRHHLTGIAGEIDDLTETLRQIAHQLHPAVIEQAGLVPALHQLASEVSRTSRLPVTTQLPADGPRLPRDLALALYRITQEALHNAVRHAQARAASVELRVEAGHLVLVITDDGHGFDPTVAADGVGLISIRERARLVHGHAAVRSRPGGGTTVTVGVPLDADAS